ncbi:hypothetical protein D3C72_1698610 [compost metagenome]
MYCSASSRGVPFITSRIRVAFTCRGWPSASWLSTISSSVCSSKNSVVSVMGDVLLVVLWDRAGSIAGTAARLMWQGLNVGCRGLWSAGLRSMTASFWPGILPSAGCGGSLDGCCSHHTSPLP